MLKDILLSHALTNVTPLTENHGALISILVDNLTVFKEYLKCSPKFNKTDLLNVTLQSMEISLPIKAESIHINLVRH